jgi:SAM-dependent methyltransferase
MKSEYSQLELNEILGRVGPRVGWDFSRMNVWSQTLPWDYMDIVRKYLLPTDSVLDIGTGGGERFLKLSAHFAAGLGTDIDPEMIEVATKNGAGNDRVAFRAMADDLNGLYKQFDTILNRHAAYDLAAIKRHLKPGGYFITQQVGELNMKHVKQALGQDRDRPPITKAMIEQAGMKCVVFAEYDVEYVVKDIDSLVFWLTALDALHADLAANEAVSQATTLNNILRGHVDDRGFVTNEQRYLAIAQV